LGQNGGLTVVSPIRKTEKSCRGPSQSGRVVGIDSRVVFGQKFPSATASSFVAKVQGEVYPLLCSCCKMLQLHGGTDCLTCQDEFFVSIPLDVKENDEQVLNFALHRSCSFIGLIEFELFHLNTRI
jgi:hypothetical protein